MSIAFFFPGQGSQSLHMMDGFNNHPVVRQTFDEACEVLHQDLWQMMNSDDGAVINETVNTQPLMLTASVATFRVYQALGGKMPTWAAGHSLGEYSALVAADCLSFADAVMLVRLRAQAMQDAVPQGVGAMAAVLGLDEATVSRLCEQSAHNQIVAAANFNSPEQTVIAGDSDAVARASEAAKAAGAKRVLPLPVSVPSHCLLMKPAAEKLQAALSDIHLKAPQFSVIHNVDVVAYNTPEKIVDALVRQLYMPVRWSDIVRQVAAHGVVESVECGPGKVLSGLVKRIDKNINCVPFNSLSAIEQWLQAH